MYIKFDLTIIIGDKLQEIRMHIIVILKLANFYIRSNIDFTFNKELMRITWTSRRIRDLQIRKYNYWELMND